MNVRLTRLLELLSGDFAIHPLRTARALAGGKRMIIARGFRVLGARNIHLDPGGSAQFGTARFGFAGRHLPGLARITGTLHIKGKVSIGSGARIEVGSAATMTVGDLTYIGPQTKVILSTGLSIGAGCAISWDCQLLDNDFHIYNNSATSSAPISIGDHVWVGSRAMVLKGASIADGCVVAAGAVVTGQFDEPNCLIGGVPARVLRKDISWS